MGRISVCKINAMLPFYKNFYNSMFRQEILPAPKCTQFKTRKYETLMRKLMKETLAKKTVLKKKYKFKLEHLEKVRKAE